MNIPFTNLNIALILGILLLVASTVPAQNSEQKDVKGSPVLWEQSEITQKDLLLGPGGQEMVPDLSRITFVNEEKGGFSTKYKIKDGAGRTWIAKIGPEAQAETAAVRLLWALGYKTEINYLVPKFMIPGKGEFQNARLEARPQDIKRGESWSWKKNPFMGKREFQGLKIMMAFFNNWDMKEANNVIVTNSGQLQYVISDLGATFGKTGSNGLPMFWRIGRSRNEPIQYAESEFIKDLHNGKIKFAFNGKNDGSMGDITRADGRWLADLLIQLNDKQIDDAFRAANYLEVDRAFLTLGVKNRIRALDLATAADAP